jgi:hypothetical protein
VKNKIEIPSGIPHTMRPLNNQIPHNESDKQGHDTPNENMFWIGDPIEEAPYDECGEKKDQLLNHY